ncbi:MAG: amylo-alpha-1,6-glucosidase, partial [Thermoplasmataceae archaeon]
GFPVFSWFFGRDGLWMGLAANMCGLGQLTRSHMETLLKHSENGRIPHEIGLGEEGAQRFVVSDNELDTRFMSIDSNLLWLLCNHSLREWGYEGFPDAEVEKVFQFSRGCDNDGDLLIENNFSKGLIGWPETWARGRNGACVDINALWLEALRIHAGSGKDYEKARKNYLNEFFGNYRFVDSIDGGKVKQIRSAMLLVPPMFMDDPQIVQSLKSLSDDSLLTYWGVRSMSSLDPMYDGGYHTGTVWPLMTGWFVVAAFRHGMRGEAYRQLESFVRLAFSSEDPGRINETYEASQPNPTGQFAQGWSSSMFILSFLGGLLGMFYDGGWLKENSGMQRISLPDGWKTVEIRNFRWRGSYCNLLINGEGISISPSIGNSRGGES